MIEGSSCISGQHVKQRCLCQWKQSGGRTHSTISLQHQQNPSRQDAYLPDDMYQPVYIYTAWQMRKRKMKDFGESPAFLL